MRVLIIPDVHLKPWIFDQADALDKNLYDNVVCLGDLFDDWGQEFNTKLYKETIERVEKFGKDHPETLWCVGNHDIGYIYKHVGNSGHSEIQFNLVRSFLTNFKVHCRDRFNIIHRIDDTLFSHAGLSDSFVKSHIFGASENDIDVIIEEINLMLYDGLAVSYSLWKDDSPVWLRPNNYYMETPFLFNGTKYFQVAGHTPVECPVRLNHCDGLLICDNFSTRRNGVPIGNQRLIVVDTENRTFVYV